MTGEHGRQASGDGPHHLLFTVLMSAIATTGLIALPLWAQDPGARPVPVESDVVVPDLLNKTVREARELLQAVGLTLELDQTVEDEARAVVELERPPKGTRVRRGSAVWVRAVMHPPAVVMVPDVRGRTVTEARTILKGSGLELEGTTGGTGRVKAQTPLPGVRAQPGTQVTVTTAEPPPPPGQSEPRPLPRSEPRPLPPPRTTHSPPVDRPAPGEASPPPPQPEKNGGTASVDRILARLELANVAFNAPTRLHLNEVSSIQLLLSTRESIEDLQRALTSAGERGGARARISNQMEAHLSGAGFRVEPITPERQAVSSSERTEWRWQIEPTRPGRLSLNLTLSADIRVEGQTVPRMIQTFERTIEVEVTWPERTKAFVAGNWQWLWTTILIPVVGWFLAKRKGRGARGKPR